MYKKNVWSNGICFCFGNMPKLPLAETQGHVRILSFDRFPCNCWVFVSRATTVHLGLAPLVTGRYCRDTRGTWKFDGT